MCYSSVGMSAWVWVGRGWSSMMIDNALRCPSVCVQQQGYQVQESRCESSIDWSCDVFRPALQMRMMVGEGRSRGHPRPAHRMRAHVSRHKAGPPGQPKHKKKPNKPSVFRGTTLSLLLKMLASRPSAASSSFVNASMAMHLLSFTNIHAIRVP